MKTKLIIFLLLMLSIFSSSNAAKPNEQDVLEEIKKIKEHIEKVKRLKKLVNPNPNDIKEMEELFGPDPNKPKLPKELPQLKSAKRSEERWKNFWSNAEKTYRKWYKDDFAFPADLYEEIYRHPKNNPYFGALEPSLRREAFRNIFERVIYFGNYNPNFYEEFTKHHQEYCSRNPNGRWKDLNYNLLDDPFIFSPPLLFNIAHLIIYKKNNRIDDLERINAEIKKLETQK